MDGRNEPDRIVTDELRNLYDGAIDRKVRHADRAERWVLRFLFVVADVRRYESKFNQFPTRQLKPILNPV